MGSSTFSYSEWEEQTTGAIVAGQPLETTLSELLARAEPGVRYFVESEGGGRWSSDNSAPAARELFSADGTLLGRVFFEGRECERLTRLAGLALQVDGVRQLARKRYAKYQAFVENASDAMFLHDSEGRVLEVNRQACDSLQYSERELIGMHPSQFDPFVSEAVMASLLERLQQGETVVVESIHRRRDGHEFPVEIRLRPFQSEGRVLALALVSDISERRLHEGMLERERRLLIQAQKMAGLGCYDWDLVSNDLWWSEVVYEIFGLSPDSFQPGVEAFYDLCVPEDLEAVEAAVGEAITGLRPFQSEVRILRPDGQVRILDSRGQVFRNEEGKPTRFLGVCQDVTDRRTAELAVRSATAALKRAHRIAELEGWTFNARTGEFRYPSDWTHRVVDSESFDDWLARVHPEDRPQVEYFWQESLAGYSRELEYRLVDQHWVRTRTEPLLDRNGAVQGLAGTTQEVTDHHHLEEQLRESQKMTAIGRLAAGVAHDFNNMLSVINGYAELLLEGAEKGSLTQEAGDAIREAGNRAASLTAQLLAFSRKSQADPQVVDLNRMIADSARVFGPLLGETIDLRLSLCDQPVFIRIDPNHFHQILMNLAVNAKHAMGQVGVLSLTTEVESLTWVQFRFSDTGAGMAPEVRQRAFEPFFTTHEFGQGPGLGLAVVHALVERWGGRIALESEPGQGTTLQMLFPLTSQPEESEPRQQPTARLGTETILLVEDDDGVRRMAKVALERSGYTVLQADSGSAALELAGQTDIQAVLTDLVMPGMGGAQLAKILRDRRPGLKVLFMSGYGEEHLRELGVELDGSYVLKKPLTPSALLAQLRTLLQEP